MATSSGAPGLSARAARLHDYDFAIRVHEQGRVVSVGDGVAWIEGLPSAAIDQLVTFANGESGLVFHLRESELGAILLDADTDIRSGTKVTLGEKRLAIQVGDAFIGRIVDPLGRPLDDRPAPDTHDHRWMDTPAPPIVDRDFVHDPLYTGNRIVDALLPIGRGQRQLLIGDHGLGKTALALDAVLNQRRSDMRCVYILIGKRRSDVVNVVQTLRSSGALEYSTVVVAEATQSPGLQYLAPFAGCTLAEAWMHQGLHTLVVYDDLTRHAQAYRALSLLLRRPPGREAYPGDIFYLHSRLLERSTVLAPALGGGSQTAFPIVETEEGEIAAYIPTNLISITDGQTYFDSDLFSAGILPPIDITRSVSRIGGKAQDKSIRAEVGPMRLDYLQFLELERFTRFGARLEASTEAKIKRGRVLREILKQERLAPVSATSVLAWLIAYNDRLLDDTPPEEIGAKLRLFSERTKNGPTLRDDRATWSVAVRSWLGWVHG
ncbi:MAG TPA: F0F1 ATP synthase subunit alpha [Candidatus Binatia bacterium]|nr:F0F1 ATP synthase subunit alpha [Candidatus Binatia bacterium]